MNLINSIINFSRKVRIFNKSRYSRNRQNVKVTFYFAIYINIAVIFTVFSMFYNFIFLLTYNWWFYFIFVSYFFVANVVRVYNKN